jgi:hypothetical protein
VFQQRLLHARWGSAPRVLRYARRVGGGLVVGLIGFGALEVLAHGVTVIAGRPIGGPAWRLLVAAGVAVIVAWFRRLRDLEPWS